MTHQAITPSWSAITPIRSCRPWAAGKSSRKKGDVLAWPAEDFPSPANQLFGPEPHPSCSKHMAMQMLQPARPAL